MRMTKVNVLGAVATLFLGVATTPAAVARPTMHVVAQPAAVARPTTRAALQFGTPGPRAAIVRGADLQQASCASRTLCLASDAQRNLMVYDGTAWTRTIGALHRRLSVLQCASPSFCLALDSLGTLSWDGQRFIRVAGPPPELGPVELSSPAVSCTSSSFCMAVGDEAWATWDGMSWSAASPYGPSGDSMVVSGVSCTGPALCLTAGTAMRFTGSAWQTVPFTGSSLDVVSCAAGASCVGLDGGGHHSFGYSVTSASWGPASRGPFPSGTDYTTPGLSCATGTGCVATLHRLASSRTDAAWSAPVTFDGTPSSRPDSDFGGAVSCVADGFCIATLVRVNGIADATVFDNGQWGTPSDVDPNHGVEFTSFDCGSPTNCVAADATNAYHYDGSQWSPATKLARHGGTAPATWANDVQDISCVGSGFCLALLTGGAVRNGTDRYSAGWAVLRGSAWLPVHADILPTELLSVSCVSQTYCVAVGWDGSSETLQGSPDAWQFDGTSWHQMPVSISGNIALSSVFCVYDPACFAAGSQPFGTGAPSVLARYSGAGWTTTTRVSTAVSDLSCYSASDCIAVDGTDRPLRYYRSSWSRSASIHGTVALTGVSCRSSGACYVADRDRGVLVQQQGFGWSDPVRVTFPTAVSCGQTPFFFCEVLSGSTRLSTSHPAG